MAPMMLWNLLACQSIRNPRCLSPWNPMIESSLLKAGGTMEMRRRRMPKQKLAPECTKTSISFWKISESGSWLMMVEPPGVEVPDASSDSGLTVNPDKDCVRSCSSIGTDRAVNGTFVVISLGESTGLTSVLTLLALERSFELGKRTRLGSRNSMNFSSIFMIASRAIYALRRR